MERGQNCQERRRRPEHFSASASAASASLFFSFPFAAPLVGVRGLSRSALPLTSNRRPGTTLGSIIVQECIHSRGIASDELLRQCPLDCVRDDEPGPMRLASAQATWSDNVAPSTCAGCFGRPGERFPLTPAHTSPARIMDLELAHGHRPRHA